MRNTNTKGFGLEMRQLNSTHREFSDDYIKSAFIRWYDMGKPAANELWTSLNNSDPTNCPSMIVVSKWIEQDFLLKGIELDQKVADVMDKTLIEDKLDMLARQAGIGKKMQDMALEYLEQNGIGSSRNAITLLVKGLETEREARSVPRFLQDLNKKTDAELLEELQKLVSTGEIIDVEAEDVTK